ncbi:DUF3710 domain-containing protein [Tsukamurella sp. 8F]|uniref:DUF3710 domain-containing protein n=1 Tax=unclassified Tsukamurella TaxID=2633480 RepID=UPI0023B9827F|nr:MULTISPECIES: DUF3710 domain-containing protein [unclassified Tsukamurella]MDF0531304.1 DUF3710 domain-containing protein [Tsukamurella sp. 8J]MDF0585253.1 DUF3710 domain-containing protein [Tsukamurella sp. 8F]
MAFGRRKSGKGGASNVDPYAEIGQPERAHHPTVPTEQETKVLGSGEGPYDLDQLEDAEALGDGRLDLGSMVLAMPPEAQMQVEMGPDGLPMVVHIDTQFGRITPGVFAAPRSGGQWREVVTEIADSLRDQGAQVTIEDGHWGREVLGRSPGVLVRFIGAEGPRWMTRFVVTAPEGSEPQAAQIARAMLAETVIRRGNEPRPARDNLEISLPADLLAHLQAAVAEQQAQAEAEAAQQAPAALRQPSQDRLTQGSALSRLQQGRN